MIIGCDPTWNENFFQKLWIFVLLIEGDSRKLWLQMYGTTTGNTVPVCNIWFPIVLFTMFGGRSPACSHICKIVKLPPSGIGSCSAICDCKWRTKEWSHNIQRLTLSGQEMAAILDSRKYRGRGICQHDANQLGISVNAFILHQHSYNSWWGKVTSDRGKCFSKLLLVNHEHYNTGDEASLFCRCPSELLLCCKLS